MYKYMIMAIISLVSAFGLAGCGGGGGGGGGSASRATTKVLLFGNISTAAKIVATVQTSITIPNGVLVNYSSAPGATTGLCNLRKGVITPSGTLLVNSADLSGTYDIAKRILTVNLVNNGSLALKSNATGNGFEVATLNFTLTATPPAMPVQDSLALIGQEILSTHDLSYPSGNKVNFVTTYQ